MAIITVNPCSRNQNPYNRCSAVQAKGKKLGNKINAIGF